MAEKYEKYDAVVLGAGPAGLSAAYGLERKGLSVAVLEEHQEVGQPEKCTGIVSRQGLKLAFPDSIGDVVIREVDFGELFIDNFVGRYEFERGKVVVLNRALLDRVLAALAVEAGAELLISTRANWTERDGTAWHVYTKKGIIKAGTLIDARGIAAYRGRKLSAKQLLVKVKGDFYEGFVVYINKEVSKAGFSWYAPLKDGIAKIGAIGTPKEIDALIEGLKRASGIGSASLGESSSAVAVGGPVYSEDASVFLVGDAGGQVKPLTAGGIVTGAIGGRLAAETFASGSKAYMAAYEKELGRELAAQVRIRELFEALNNKALIQLAKALPGSQPLFVGDEFDSHTNLLKRTLRIPSFYLALLEVAPKHIIEGLRRIITT